MNTSLTVNCWGDMGF